MNRWLRKRGHYYKVLIPGAAFNVVAISTGLLPQWPWVIGLVVFSAGVLLIELAADVDRLLKDADEHARSEKLQRLREGGEVR